MILELTLINAGTKCCIMATFWYFVHLKDTSVETHNNGIHFENTFGFQDNGNWLVIDDTIARLSALILIKKPFEIFVFECFFSVNLIKSIY